MFSQALRKRDALAGTESLQREGSARIHSRTKELVKHLRRGEVAVIRHPDLDSVAARALIERKPAFVVNPDARPEEVALDMANDKRSAALAIRAGRVLGIVTTTDLARALGLTLRAQRGARERAEQIGWGL